MRKEDFDLLNEAYLTLPENERVELGAGFYQILIPSVSELVKKISSDLDEEKFGIGWWSIYPLGTRRRIFISDYFFQATVAIEANLIEAKTSLYYSRGLKDSIAKKLKDVIKVKNGAPWMQLPLKESMTEHLEENIFQMHQANFFRAMGSAMDCLCASVTGVLGIPTEIFKVGYSKLFLGKLKLENAQSHYMQKIIGYERRSGPEGWLGWALEYRNMLVHRGRLVKVSRAEFESFKTERGALIRPEGFAIGNTNTTSHLPAEPDLSEVEILSQGVTGIFLTEESVFTMEGIFQSAVAFVEDTARLLNDAWEARKADLNLIKQPIAQWKDTKRISFLKFNGYAPGRLSRDANLLQMSPLRAKKMRTAALLGRDLERWPEFD